MCQSNSKTGINSSCGFTLVEVVIVIGIIGVLAAVAVPIMSTFTKRAEYHSLMATLDQLLDAQDSYYILNNSFYPASGRIRVNSGQERDIPELGFRFPAGHKHRYIIRGQNTTTRTGIKINYYWIYIYADDDYNGDGRNDYYLVQSRFRNGEPYSRRGITYDRLIQQIY